MNPWAKIDHPTDLKNLLKKGLEMRQFSVKEKKMPLNGEFFGTIPPIGTPTQPFSGQRDCNAPHQPRETYTNSKLSLNYSRIRVQQSLFTQMQ